MSIDRESIEQKIAAYGSIEHFIAAITDPGEAVPVQVAAIVMECGYLPFLTRRKMPDFVSPLLDEMRWTQLVPDPKLFDRELRRELARIKREMKAFYRIQKHRPVKKAHRDWAIWNDKRNNPDLTYGQIAIEYGIKPQAARSAFERWGSREQVRIKKFAALWAEGNTPLPASKPPAPVKG